MWVVGDLLKFKIYNTTVEGTFVRVDGDIIIIKTTSDFLGDIGKEQSIHKCYHVLTPKDK